MHMDSVHTVHEQVSVHGEEDTVTLLTSDFL